MYAYKCGNGTWPKRQANLAKHGVDFADVVHLDLGAAFIEVDDRRDYGEVRLEATGLIGNRLHVLVFTTRGAAVRVISLRKANTREEARWARRNG